MKNLISLAWAVATLGSAAVAQELRLELIANGMSRVTDMRQAPGDNERFFVTSARTGIFIVEDGAVQPNLFLDMTTLVPPLHNTQGLMSLAFDPDYQANGKFYVCYMDDTLQTHLVQYSVSADPEIADPGSAQHILGPFQQPAVTHNWDNLHFGPDGMLYFSTGDGVDTTDVSTNNAQDLGSILGKILRLDMDLPAPYVPADNPFVGVAGAREEVWMYGLRQPWRFCFDSANGDLFIADVGYALIEELNYLPASGGLGGQNFGWRCMEGTICHSHAGCNPMCDDPSWTEPIYQYPHDGRCAIIGGFVYRGAALPALQGSYFFADYCTAGVYSLRYDGTQITELVDRSLELVGPGPGSITSFAQDHAGELYVLDRMGGEIWKIVEADDCSVTRYCPASPNTVGPGGMITTNGETSVAANSLELGGLFLPPNLIGIFIYGADQNNAPFGNGTLCLTGLQRIYPPAQIDSAGRTSYAVDLNAPPANSGPGQITVGSTWNFQLWYRDPMGSPAPFNGTDALEITFCP